MTIGIIDYGGGNLQSVRNALRSLGHDPVWIRDLDDISDFQSLSSDLPPAAKSETQNQKSEIRNRKSQPLAVVVFPGQGEFGDCSRALASRGLTAPLRDWINGGRPYFGICIGYQILFESSEEYPDAPGLNIFPGTVVRFPADRGLKIPHMGWNELRFIDPADPLWRGLPGAAPASPSSPARAHAYFVHSYYPAPDAQDLAACTTDYEGISFISAVRRGSLFASQFHPEKSQRVGLTILKNYLEGLVVSNRQSAIGSP